MWFWSTPLSGEFSDPPPLWCCSVLRNANPRLTRPEPLAEACSILLEGFAAHQRTAQHVQLCFCAFFMSAFICLMQPLFSSSHRTVCSTQGYLSLFCSTVSFPPCICLLRPRATISWPNHINSRLDRNRCTTKGAEQKKDKDIHLFISEFLSFAWSLCKQRLQWAGIASNRKQRL